SILDFVDAGSIEKGKKFLEELREQGGAGGWEIVVSNGLEAWPLSFSGAAGETSMIILAAPAARETMDHGLYDELSRLNNELINRERELARKGVALERLSAEKTRLLAIAAHDLRNPLTIVGAYADMLKGQPGLDEESMQWADEISRSARFMRELVEELLDSSRLESGHVEVDLQEVDLVAAARHAGTINRMRADMKQIPLGIETEVEKAVIRADPVKLRQIVNNLVVNAIKFSRSGSPVTIRVRSAAGRALLEVVDQGIGIPPNQLSTIFEPFATVGPSGTAGEPSVGLGLAIVKNLVQLHNATVEVESEEGRGSIFRVAFPSVVDR
ncbi:MAG TPA: HAMP domain-containing sensor histidine kinase, partial [Thermoanaerobaculia bacterium]|nr:HAMP domain-containing sensor histidine kinase [Thermoanaerobaculia bacterium]